MCYAIPGKVVGFNGNLVIIDYFGETKQAINEIDDLKIGDYIYAQGGYVIKYIPELEAQAILATWKETFFDLQALDLRLSRTDLNTRGIDKKLALILDKTLEQLPLKNEELLFLLGLEDEIQLNYLFKVANFLRRKYLGNSCCVHGIIEISSYCNQNCSYCGISSHNQVLPRYRMLTDEILATVNDAVEKYGFKALVLQAGEDPALSVDYLADLIAEIKRRHAVLIFISFGEIGTPGLEKLYRAGARGLLMRFETSNPELYAKLHFGRTLQSRLEHLQAASQLGYLIITGGLVGLPGQTTEDRLNDIFLAKQLRSEMYTFGPFLPHPATPLRQVSAPVPQDILKTLAVCRLNDSANAKILVTTGFETLSKNAREDGLLAGANSVMLNVTPAKYSRNYCLYPNRAHTEEELQAQIDSTLKILLNLGRAPTDLGINYV